MSAQTNDKSETDVRPIETAAERPIEPAAVETLDGEIMDVDSTEIELLQSAAVKPAAAYMVLHVYNSPDENPAIVYLASLPGESGRRTQKQALQVIAQALGGELSQINWGAMRYQHTAAIRAKLLQTYSVASVNKMLSALRQTLKRAYLLGQMTAEDYQRAIMLDRVEGETLPAGREVTPGEMLALMNVCQNDKNERAGVRDAALISVMYTAGLRRDEVVNLSLDSFNPETGQLTVTGKRQKQRTAYIENGAYDALMDWLQIRGSEPGALFVSIDRGERLGDGMTSQAVYNILQKRAEQAGIKSFSPHDLRRSFVSELLDKGADIATVAKMAGHKNVQTTARYDRRPEEAKRKAAKLLHVPYKKRATQDGKK